VAATPRTRAAEVADKVAQVRDLLRREGAVAMAVGRVSNFAWLSAGGRSFIPVTGDVGAAWVVVSADRVVVCTSNIEAARLAEEELDGLDWEVQARPWWEGAPLAEVQRVVGGAGPVLADAPLPGARDAAAELARLRARLCPEEQLRAAAVGRDTAWALEDCCRAIARGDSEFAIAGRLAKECYARGIEPVVHLVAADDRVFTRRHPLPTDRRVAHYAMVVVCGMRAGLVLSATRLVHLGPVPPELRRRWEAAARVDAEMIAASRPGVTAGQVLAVAQEAYARLGFPEEWRQHHQGGLAGYASREWRAVPGGPEPLAAGQIVAWNPSVAGAKSEDTVLVRDAGPATVLTATGAWPVRGFTAHSGDAIARPEILEL
jgi:Xaa-Pro aminopeptidase